MQTPSTSTAKKTGQNIRPTADRAREALFSIIGREVEGATVLDLFAGTGALGLEALSRSALQAVFIDNNTQAIQLIGKNVDLCGFSDRTHILKRDLSRGLGFLEKQLPGIMFNIVFVDPPYRKKMSEFMLHELAKTHFLTRDCIIIVEEDSQSVLPDRVSGLVMTDQRRYGDTGFWLYVRDCSCSKTFQSGENLHG